VEKNHLLASLFLKTAKGLKVCGNFVSMPLLSFVDAKHLNPSLLVGLLRGEGSLSLSCLFKNPLGIRCKERGAIPLMLTFLYNLICSAEGSL